MRRLRAAWLPGAFWLAALCLAGAARAEVRSWDAIKQSGTISFAVYQDNAPFSGGTSDQPKGIDVDLARALAQQLGLKPQFLVFSAAMDSDGSVNDDLRNMVWKGHYMGYGPADVMMQVPVDPALMNGNPQVLIFGPYYRHNFRLAHDVHKLPEVPSAAALRGLPVGVIGAAAPSVILRMAEGDGAPSTLRHYRDATLAAQALKAGEVVAVLATQAELESNIAPADRKRYAIDAFWSPGLPRQGWAVGMAVAKRNEELAKALQGALNTLREGGRIAPIFEAAQLQWVKP